MVAWLQRQLFKELPVTASVSRANVTASDTVVVETDDQLTMAQVKRVSAAVRGAFPDSKVLILDRGQTLKIVRTPPA